MGRYVYETPTKWNSRGEAVLEGNGRKLVSFGAIAGEKAKLHVVHEGRNQDLAIFSGSKTPSPHRVEPPCDRYSVCGGCPLMHMDAKGQASAQRWLLRNALDTNGLHDVGISARHDCPDGDENYRHVIKVGFGRSDQGRPRMGAWGRRNRNIVPIPKCNVAAPVLRHVMVSLAHWSQEMNMYPYEVETDRGVLRAAILRASHTTGEVLVTLIVGRTPRNLTDLAEEVARAVSEVAGVFAHINAEPGNGLFDYDEEGAVLTKRLCGKQFIEETIGDISYRIGPGDFFQTNPSVAKVLYARVLDRLDLQKDEPFVDLYCGVGGLALQAAKRTGWSLGVETVQGAVTRARDAAHRNGVTADFMAGDVLELLPELRKRHANLHPVISVNPARRGLEPGVVEEIIKWEPRRIAYVSCNPERMAEDLAKFHSAGFSVEDVEMFDMFPHTAHSECLVTLTPKHAVVAARAPKRKLVR
jgi:23S rRNA (uracil1939-C5)-methyltransferase